MMQQKHQSVLGVLLFVAVLLAASLSPSCQAAARIQRSKYPATHDQPRQRRRLDKGSGKGFTSSSKKDKDKDKEDGAIGSNGGTVAPTASAAPSASFAPSTSPTVSAAPSQSPTTAMPSTSPSDVPTTSPTASPSDVPSVSPTVLPSASPSVSSAPTDSPYTTNAEDATNAVLESTCDNPVPTDDITPLVSQLFAYQVEIQLDTFLLPDDDGRGTDVVAEEKAGESEVLVHNALAKALLGNCAYQGDTGVAQFSRIHMYQPDSIIDVTQQGVCPAGIVCYDMAGDFVGDFFMKLPAEPGIGGPTEVVGVTEDAVAGLGGPPTRHRRRLQQIQQTIKNGPLLAEIGQLLKDIYDNMDTGDDGTKFIFKGFTNPEALESTPDTDPTTDRGGPDGVAAVENAPQALAEKGNGAIAGVVLGCAAIVLIAVSVLAVQRRRQDSKGFVMDHMALEDDEYYDDDDDDDDFYRDDEATSNPKDILADLQDQEEASMAAGTTYSSTRKVYVLSDQDSASASVQYLGGGGDSYYSGRIGEPPTQTHFVKALSQSALSDLGPTKSSMGSNRSYVAEDTVDL
uniref:Uncharacterized protein n=1 Tax=Amphora coffeiformis TaxID=265554 RepID=A0A7S3P112_9STRA